MNRSLSVHVVLVLSILVIGWLVGEKTVGQGPVEATDAVATAGEDLSAKVAVVDMKRIFNEHAGFQESLAELKVAVDTYSKGVAVRQAEIESVQKKMQTIKPGTPDHERAQLLLARLQTELKFEAARRKQQVMNREMRLYNETYAQITTVVTRYADANGIQLVLRSTDERIDPDNRESVLGAVNRMIVYQRGLDISEKILAELNAEEQPAS